MFVPNHFITNSCMNRNDVLWKGIIESICTDMLQFFFRETDELFDFDKGFHFLDKELEQLFPSENTLPPKFVDKLIKVFTKGGSEEWILCHVEVQGYDDRDFARRMFTYFYRILDKYEKPVTAIAIFTDTNPGFHPKVYEYKFLGTQNIFSFNSYKVLGQDEAVLEQDSNPFAIVILTVLLALKKKKLDDDSLYALKYDLAKNLLSKKIPRKKINDLMVFLQHYVLFANQEYNVKFEKGIDLLTESRYNMGIQEQVLDLAKKKGWELGKTEGMLEGIEKGLEKGLEKGIEEGKAEVVKHMLATQHFNISTIADLVGVSEDFVRKVQAAT
jgi:predicted transposase/invertase (TIGR01784 family)